MFKQGSKAAPSIVLPTPWSGPGYSGRPSKTWWPRELSTPWYRSVLGQVQGERKEIPTTFPVVKETLVSPPFIKGGCGDFAEPLDNVGAIREPPLREALSARGELVEPRAVPGSTDTPDRRMTLWEVGLRYRPGGAQLALPLPVEQDMAELTPQDQWEVMLDEYLTLGLHPKGHLMAMLRPHLPPEVLSSQEMPGLADGEEVTVAGLVIRRQRPLGKAVFVTLEDEFGHIPLVVWPQVYDRYRLVLREPVLIMRGEVSRRDGTMNIVAKHLEKIGGARYLPKAKSWQ